MNRSQIIKRTSRTKTQNSEMHITSTGLAAYLYQELRKTPTSALCRTCSNSAAVFSLESSSAFMDCIVVWDRAPSLWRYICIFFFFCDLALYMYLAYQENNEKDLNIILLYATRKLEQKSLWTSLHKLFIKEKYNKRILSVLDHCMPQEKRTKKNSLWNFRKVSL